MREVLIRKTHVRRVPDMRKHFLDLNAYSYMQIQTNSVSTELKMLIMAALMVITALVALSTMIGEVQHAQSIETNEIWQNWSNVRNMAPEQ